MHLASNLVYDFWQKTAFIETFERYYIVYTYNDAH